MKNSNKNMCELQQLLDFFKDRIYKWEKSSKSDYELDIGHNMDDYSVVYYFLCDKRGFSKFPKFVSEKEYQYISEEAFKTLSSKGREYYHGFTEFDHGASYLWDSYYHYGDGDFGNGFYMSSNELIAMLYTREIFSKEENKKLPDKKKIMRARILSDNFSTYGDLQCLCMYLLDGNKNGYKTVSKRTFDYNKISLEQLKKENERSEKFSDLVEFINNIEDDDLKRKFVMAFTSNFPAMGVYLGFDYIIRAINLDDSDEQIMVFNRSCLAVNNNEANRIFKLASDKYSWIELEK